MNAPFLHRSLTEAKNPVFNGVSTSDIIYGDSSSFNFRNDIWSSQYEQVFPKLYSEGYAIHEHLAPFGLVYLKELTGYFAEGPDIGTSGFYNNLAIDDDLGNVNSSIETGCNTHRQTDWVRDKPGQEAYFDKNVTSKDDPDLKGRIYVGKTIIELRENNFLYYGDEKGDLYQHPLPIFGLKENTRKPSGQGDNVMQSGDGSIGDLKNNPPDHPEHESPKGGDRKVRNPNGRGIDWLDNKGRVWVPEDHNGTHASRWERQEPKGGGYTPVYPFAQPAVDPSMRDRIGQMVGLSGTALTIYLIISEVSRLFPPRNLVPVP